VHVSQAPPTLVTPGVNAEVRLRAADLGVPMLGAVLAYGALVATAAARLGGRGGGRARTPGQPLRHPGAATEGWPAGVEVDAGVAETFDLAVVAEGGVFADQARKALVATTTGQTAWVGRSRWKARHAGHGGRALHAARAAALLPLPGARPTAAPAPRWCGA
jgi:2-octaprenyl-6-methoxyphenol hydroxylase